MEFMIHIDLKKLHPPIQYRDKIVLTGSCFTEHIGNTLGKLKFSVLQNPHGILFGPDAVCNSLGRYISNKPYVRDDLFLLNEVWNTWDHHSSFSGTDPGLALKQINDSVEQAHDFLKEADWLIITLGSSFSYRLTSMANKAGLSEGAGVANCHRAPANWFEKKMLEINSVISLIEKCILDLKLCNPKLKIIFTISPVRHIRDGVVENNRSKARLIEAVHEINLRFDHTYYFPAYELVIDVLRDYRYYDIDLVHPNYPATDYVMEQFTETCIDEESRKIMKEVKKIISARRHRPFWPDTKAHEQFLKDHFEKAKTLQDRYPFLDLKEELHYFSKA